MIRGIALDLRTDIAAAVSGLGGAQCAQRAVYEQLAFAHVHYGALLRERERADRKRYSQDLIRAQRLLIT